MRMRVADTDDSMSAIEVQILLSLVVPHLTTFAFDDVYIKERINVE